MIEVNDLINILKKNQSDFFTGVPDSVLKELSDSLQKKNKKNHIIATNEGSAISIGIGYYLSTKKVPIIYMQNSGLSNALNPLISIAHKNVYSIPLILIIGWRGSPRIKDEPQHNEKGKITKQILKLLKIKYTILRSKSDLKKFYKQVNTAKKSKSIVACLIERGILKKSSKILKKQDYYKLDKEYFLKNLLMNLQKKTKVISSTGYNSREIMYLRKNFNLRNGKDFYMVGGMGHTTGVALGYSLSSKKTTIA
jgi:Predicted thiamine-pyrophosphate-binding protein